MEKLKQYLSIRGNLTALANELPITLGAIPQWRKVPAEHVLTVERVTGISRYELRPDVFGEKPDLAREQANLS